MNKQKSRTIVTALLSLTLASGIIGADIPTVYAVTAANTQTASAEKPLITGNVAVSPKYNHMMLCAIDKEGSTYYRAFDQAANFTEQVPFYTVKVNIKGEVVASVKGNCDDIRVIGDKVYVLQEGGRDENNKPLKGITCKVYDTDLKLLQTYNLSYSSRIQYSGVNSKKFCYINGGKVYSCDLNGKNKKMLYDLFNGELKGMEYSGLAVTEEYVGLTAKKYDDKGNIITYCISVNMSTGKAEISKQPLLDNPVSFGNRLVWRSTNDNKGSIFSSSKQLVIWDNGKFTIVKMSSNREALNSPALDSDGNIITIGYSNKESWLKVYKNGKAVKQIKLSHNPISVQAENGVIAYCYEEQSNGRYYVKSELIPY